MEQINLLVSAMAESGLAQTCDPSLDGTDCVKYPYEMCSEELLICEHKEVFPVLTMEIVGLLLLPVLLAFASAGGVGGGLVIVPIAVSLFQFSSKEAIAVSILLVLETAVIRFFFFSCWKKHPEVVERTEIDYNTVRMVYPLFLIGSYVGVIAYMLISPFWIAILVFILLGTLSVHMIFTSIKKYKEETKTMEAKKYDFVEMAEVQNEAPQT